MKRSNKIIMLSLWGIFLISSSFAQVSSNDKNPGYWTFGMNAGSAYQQSDVSTDFQGWGAGMTLGKSIIYRPYAPFSLDLRGRVQYSQSYGLDYFKSQGIENNEALNGTRGPDYTIAGDGPGFVYANHKTEMGEVAMEGVLNFNQLRENSNVNLSLYGGLGLGAYGTSIDQKFGSKTYADEYAALDEKSSVSYKKSVLKNDILDGTYETRADGFQNGIRVGIMPSAGAELGYQLSPNVSVGVGHRITYAKTDYLDGQKWNNSNKSTGDNDVQHYSSVNLNFTIPSKGKRLAPPRIIINSPARNPITTKDPNALVKATIRNVNSSIDINCRINGRDVHFDFYNDDFTKKFWLEPGRNEVLITASNLTGSDRKKIVILYEEPFVDPYYPPTNGGYPPPARIKSPQVDITSPSGDYVRVDRDYFTVKAVVKNVWNTNDIAMLVNGVEHDFSYNRNIGVLSSRIHLYSGNNKVVINAWNEKGEDRDQTLIILEDNIVEDYPEYIDPPKVEILIPSRNYFTTTSQRSTIRAKIRNVDLKSDVSFEINGRKTSDFRLNGTSFHANIRLNPGENFIKITARNEAGYDADKTTINVENQNAEPPTSVEVFPPAVSIISVSTPNSNPGSSQACKSTVTAQIENIEAKSDIKFLVNGSRSYDFSFNPNNQTFKSTIKLGLRTTSIKIIVTNEYGRAEDSTTAAACQVNQPGPKPVVQILTPGSGSRTDKAFVEVKAKVQHVASSAKIIFQLNGRSITDFTYNTHTDRLVKKVKLQEGQNVILIKGFNSFGATQVSSSVYYQAPMVYIPKLPEVKITKPTVSKTSKSSVAVEANVRNVKTKSNITMSINGRSINSFDFSPASNKIKANVRLQKGLNKILIKVLNSDGQDQSVHHITYELPALKPVVTIKTPTPNSRTTNPAVSLSASIKNVKSKTEVQVILNGKATERFSFNGANVSAKLKLKEGNNTITVKARTSAGADGESVTVFFKPTITISKPTVRFGAPSAIGQKVRAASYNLKAIVKNTKETKLIALIVNGRSQNNFSFNAKTGELNAMVNLQYGKNTFSITATNKAGSATASTHVLRQRNSRNEEVSQAAKPRVTIVSAGRPALSRNGTRRSSLVAKVENVGSRNQIEFVVNGKKVDDFRFDPNSRKLTTNVSLSRGSTVIKIKATNEAGSHEASRTLRL